MDQNTEERDTRNGILNLIMFGYIGFGSVVTFLGNVSSMNEYPDLTTWVSIFIFLSAAIFPLLGGAAILAGRNQRNDTLYTIYLYLVYNLVVALLNLEWMAVLFDLVCAIYFYTSTLVEELWPEDETEWSERLIWLTGAACLGIVMQISLFFL